MTMKQAKDKGVLDVAYKLFQQNKPLVYGGASAAMLAALLGREKRKSNDSPQYDPTLDMVEPSSLQDFMIHSHPRDLTEEDEEDEEDRAAVEKQGQAQDDELGWGDYDKVLKAMGLVAAPAVGYWAGTNLSDYLLREPEEELTEAEREYKKALMKEQLAALQVNRRHTMKRLLPKSSAVDSGRDDDDPTDDEKDKDNDKNQPTKSEERRLALQMARLLGRGPGRGRALGGGLGPLAGTEACPAPIKESRYKRAATDSDQEDNRKGFADVLGEVPSNLLSGLSRGALPWYMTYGLPAGTLAGILAYQKYKQENPDMKEYSGARDEVEKRLSMSMPRVRFTRVDRTPDTEEEKERLQLAREVLAEGVDVDA